MLIFVLYSKTPHAQNAHLFDPGHVCKCFLSQHQGVGAHQGLALRPQQGERQPEGSRRGRRLWLESFLSHLVLSRLAGESGWGPARGCPRDTTTRPTHSFPPRRPCRSHETLRLARIYAIHPGHAGKREARGARAASASGSSTAQRGWAPGLFRGGG